MGNNIFIVDTTDPLGERNFRFSFNSALSNKLKFATILIQRIDTRNGLTECGKFYSHYIKIV